MNKVLPEMRHYFMGRKFGFSCEQLVVAIYGDGIESVFGVHKVLLMGYSLSLRKCEWGGIFIVEKTRRRLGEGMGSQVERA